MSTPEQQPEVVEDDAYRSRALKMVISGLFLGAASFFISSAFVHAQVSRDERVPQDVRDFHADQERRDLVSAIGSGGIGLVALANLTIPVFRSREEEIVTPPAQTP